MSATLNQSKSKKSSNEYMKEYMKKYWDKTRRCDCCDKEIKAGGFFKHVKTLAHLRKANKMKPDDIASLTSKIDELQKTINELCKSKKN
jgi:hypothetical protein